MENDNKIISLLERIAESPEQFENLDLAYGSPEAITFTKDGHDVEISYEATLSSMSLVKPEHSIHFKAFVNVDGPEVMRWADVDRDWIDRFRHTWFRAVSSATSHSHEGQDKRRDELISFAESL